MTVAEPLVTALRPGPLAPPAHVAAALARSLAQPEADDPAPGWLWPEQHASFRRAVAAIRIYGGAMLADPVGTGKTYIALAVAAALNRRPTACIVPAALREQWRAVAAGLSVPIIVWSHERVSRGALPESCGRLVLVDESHHFRNPGTRRYRCLAPWLVNRRALLVSASPVPNRLPELGHQLALTLRDDALRRHGVPSLAVLLEGGRGHHALGHVIVVRSAASARRPGARERVVRLDDSTLAPLGPALALVDRLRLSTRAPIAALVRAALWRAAASSPAALAAAVDRYRRLLLHARDAARSGRMPDRRALRTLTRDLDDQLLLWDLLDPVHGTPDLEPGDLPLLEELRGLLRAAARGPDPKAERLGEALADGRPTLVFTVARETVGHLRDRLPGPLAWCTGDRAGIGRQPVPRRVVLDWFRPTGGNNGSVQALAPRHLISTDVAAEGLDLHRAERVIHYDLPWTPARLEQREGRARRAGAAHAEVEVVRLDPPPMVETRLRQLACLAAKRRLPAVVGLNAPGRALWRWRADLAERFGRLTAAEGVALLRAEPPGILAGFAIHAWPGAGPPVGTDVLWWDEQSGWTDEPEILAARLEVACARGGPGPHGGHTEHGPRGPLSLVPAAQGGFGNALAAMADIDAALVRLAEPIRRRMAGLRQSRWLGAHVTPTARRLLERFQALARRAARRRDAVTLERLHHAIRFAAGGHTAGERAWVAELAGSSDPALEAALPSLPAPTPEWDAVHARLTGLVIFQPR